MSFLLGMAGIVLLLARAFIDGWRMATPERRPRRRPRPTSVDAVPQEIIGSHGLRIVLPDQHPDDRQTRTGTEKCLRQN